MDLIRKYDQFKEIKEEIDKFTSLLLSQKSLPNINELKSISKYIIFMKTFVNYTGESHYKNSLIFDILSVMNSLTKDSLRQFHYVFRSFIENYARAMLNLNDHDETGVNELFRRLKELIGEDEIASSILDYIIGEYGKSCMFVHSNSKSNMSIQLFYTDLINQDDFNTQTLSSVINKVLLILKKMTELTVHVYPSTVENAFYRKKQHLRYLIGDQTFQRLLHKVRM
ncbi:hypothetical protein J7E38_13700 [Bacillus sp. ISL-35]|uniref:hypothetical protein n=1 Tax=Bacillus sp. ISL-35 TaxID=2819122 RepID=UPI001BE95189|nr:hypothetical protein [Bacillus sp. ISL-35]MBT2680064.1 hypothetical protein [Bacillus sp. ISL-35]MBT2702959.1 hypothetical protein [Chryseobacterium sp. ISL-80]